MRSEVFAIALVMTSVSSTVAHAQQRIIAEMPTKRMFRDHERASLACPAAVPWVCVPARLARFNAQVHVVVNTPADVVGTAKVLERTDDRCPVGVDIALRAHEDVVVDWSRVTFIANGIVAQAVPGRTRAITAALAQRPSAAPAGAILSEAVMGVDGACLAPSAYYAGQPITLDMPIRLGGRDERATVTVQLENISATEADAFGLLPAPNPGAEPPAPFAATPAALVTGASIGVVLGVGMGVGFAIGTVPTTPGSTPLGTGIGVGVAASIAYGGLGTLAGWGIGALLDGGVAGAAETHAVWAKRTSELAAWKVKRTELGLPTL